MRISLIVSPHVFRRYDPTAEEFSTNLPKMDRSVHERRETLQIEREQLPEVWVAYIRQVGPYGLQPTFKTLQRVTRWARSRKLLEAGRVLGIPWHNPRVTPPEDCWYDACVTVAEGFESDHPRISVQVIPAGNYLVRRCRADNGDLETPWQEFLAWYRESGWEMTDGPCFEVYESGCYSDSSGNWELALHIPVA